MQNTCNTQYNIHARTNSLLSLKYLFCWLWTVYNEVKEPGGWNKLTRWHSGNNFFTKRFFFIKFLLLLQSFPKYINSLFILNLYIAHSCLPQLALLVTSKVQCFVKTCPSIQSCAIQKNVLGNLVIITNTDQETKGYACDMFCKKWYL